MIVNYNKLGKLVYKPVYVKLQSQMSDLVRSEVHHSTYHQARDLMVRQINDVVGWEVCWQIWDSLNGKINIY